MWLLSSTIVLVSSAKSLGGVRSERLLHSAVRSLHDTHRRGHWPWLVGALRVMARTASHTASRSRAAMLNTRSSGQRHQVVSIHNL